VKYHVTAAGRTFEVTVEGERVTVDGQPVEAHLSLIPGTSIRHLLLGARSLGLILEPVGRGRWIVTRFGRRQEVEVVDERTRHIRAQASTGPHPAAAGALRAPMPGLVVRVNVEAGQQVAGGEGVVVLEAMKMENELRAPGPGRVTAIRVEAGQAVEKGEVLLEFEDLT
jgi:pyruvate carboxylase subunit B